MTSLSRHRRRAEQLAALVDATAATGAHGDSTADPLDRELVELLQLVSTLSSYPQTSGLEERATPRPAHTLQLRERLMTEAAQVLTPERAERHAVLTLPQRRAGGRERRLAAAATVLVVLGGTTGMAAAAEQSLPGQALYPVKRGIERVDVALSASTAGKGRDVLHQASTRLDEVTRLAEGPPESVVQIPGTMKEFSRQAQEGTSLMMQAYRETADPATIQTVQDFAQTEGHQVEQLAAKPEVGASLTLAAASTLNSIQEATLVCDECPALPLDPILVSVSTDGPPVVMRAADGTALDGGELPPELGTVPATGDSGGGGDAPADGSGAAEALPGLPDDPAASSPLPPVDGTGGGPVTDAPGTETPAQPPAIEPTPSPEPPSVTEPPPDTEPPPVTEPPTSGPPTDDGPSASDSPSAPSAGDDRTAVPSDPGDDQSASPDTSGGDQGGDSSTDGSGSASGGAGETGAGQADPDSTGSSTGEPAP